MELTFTNTTWSLWKAGVTILQVRSVLRETVIWCPSRGMQGHPSALQHGSHPTPSPHFRLPSAARLSGLHAPRCIGASAGCVGADSPLAAVAAAATRRPEGPTAPWGSEDRGLSRAAPCVRSRPPLGTGACP